MKYGLRIFLALWLGMLGRAASADVQLKGENLSTVPPETLKLYENFIKNYVEWGDQTLLTDLAHAPDGDLCLLDAYEKHRDGNSVQEGTAARAAKAMLGKLDSKRIYDVLMIRLDSPDYVTRVSGIQILGAFHRPECIGRVIRLLKEDNDNSIRDDAAIVLGAYNDPRIEPVLLEAANANQRKDGDLSLRTLEPLARLRSKAGFTMMVKTLTEATNPDVNDMAAADIAVYHNKEAVRVLLENLKRAEAKEGVLRERGVSWTSARLFDCLKEAKAGLGMFPLPRYDEWSDFWNESEPLLTDDLQLKVKVAAGPAREYQQEEYLLDPVVAKLTVASNAKEYRVGDPIRLHMDFRNEGRGPISVVPLKFYPYALPATGMGALLKRDGQIVLELSPPRTGAGSYGGPPKFETMDPGAAVSGDACLQQWLSHSVNLPLQEGSYQLTVTYDPSKYRAIQATGVQMLYAWRSQVVNFTIKGEARRDPKEILRVVETASGVKFIAEDAVLKEDVERKIRAWGILRQYGDSRLAPLLESLGQKADGLPAFESAPAVRGQRGGAGGF